jgi:phosphoglycolate phosphatase
MSPLVVFDWDGTLMDSTHAITSAIQRAAAELGLPVPSREQASWVIGLGLQDALARAVPELPAGDVPQFVAAYRRHYLLRDPELVLFEGAVELLDELLARGCRLAVATGKSRVGLDRALAQTGLRDRFEMTRCADETHPKPHPAMLLELMNELGAEPGQTWMVGDTTHDLDMAAAAGTNAIGVLWGAHSRDELLSRSPRALVSSLVELAGVLPAGVRS